MKRYHNVNDNLNIINKEENRTITIYRQNKLNQDIVIWHEELEELITVLIAIFKELKND